MSTATTVNDARTKLILKERLDTLKKWIFKDNSNAKCTAEEMAKAGFFIISEDEPDAVKCFLCGKQLDGWEPEDIPFEEHTHHAPYCSFVKLKKQWKNLTMTDLFSLAMEMELKVLDNTHQERLKQVKTLEQNTIQEILGKHSRNK